ncbi:YgjP-like metallopeptidase domain-containing protein [uncultured Gammaproteobacteria bacterium]
MTTFATEPPLEIRRSARAQRLTMRVDPLRGVIQVVVPAWVGEAEISRFVLRHRAWASGRLEALPPAHPFIDGALVPVLGIDHRVRHQTQRRGGEIAEGEIRVGGQPDHIARRVRDLLIAEARRELAERARSKAAQIGARVAAVTVRDTTSRWGSCSAQGRLSFSWRLILAPEVVLDYVVAHEVAHLQEMNHSPCFWGLVAKLTPRVTAPRAWLKVNGARLFRLG